MVIIKNLIRHSWSAFSPFNWYYHPTLPSKATPPIWCQSVSQGHLIGIWILRFLHVHKFAWAPESRFPGHCEEFFLLNYRWSTQGCQPLDTLLYLVSNQINFITRSAPNSITSTYYSQKDPRRTCIHFFASSLGQRLLVANILSTPSVMWTSGRPDKDWTAGYKNSCIKSTVESLRAA